MFKQLIALIAAPLSLLWGAVAFIRGKLFDWGILHSESYDIPVICVGNLAVGGTGKTPHVEYLLSVLHESGYRVAMLSRGYGRQTKGFIRATSKHSAADIGDEPFQMMQNCPYAQIAVCEQRVEGMRHLLTAECPPDVVVLDDAYQHRYVQAGLNILLTDAARLYTRDHLLPWGRLREPASAAARAHWIVVTKCQAGERPALSIGAGQQLFYSEICYGTPFQLGSHHSSYICDYAGRKILLVAGIANPGPLVSYLRQQGAINIEVVAYPDHHMFTSADISHINRIWQKMLNEDTANASRIMAVTTQKDATRLTHFIPELQPQLVSQFFVQPITVKVSTSQENQVTFKQNILDYVSQHSRNSCVD